MSLSIVFDVTWTGVLIAQLLVVNIVILLELVSWTEKSIATDR